MDSHVILASMSSADAADLADELRKIHSTGGDERALASHLCNHFRVKKHVARELLDSYLQGFHAGVGEALVLEREKTTNIPDNPLYDAAYQVGLDEINGLIEDRRAVALPAQYLVLLAVLAGLAIAIAVGLWLMD